MAGPTEAPGSLPEEDREPVDIVLTHIHGYGPVIHRIRWGKSVIPVKETTSRWESRDGAFRVDHFTVKTAGGEILQLCRHRERDTWWIAS